MTDFQRAFEPGTQRELVDQVNERLARAEFLPSMKGHTINAQEATK